VDRKETGKLGEKAAASFLKSKGYRIIETNYRCRSGEMDIIARKDDCVVFVEVRTKTSLKYGTPEESITPTKALHLEKTAEFYQQNHAGLPELWRVDLVAIEMESDGRIRRIEHIENALEK
jgi:putative endonuclease